MLQQEAVTDLLQAWSAGDKDAAVRVMPMVFDELRAIARSHFRRERRGHTLQPTVLVHEAWVRLIEQSGVRFRSQSAEGRLTP